MASSKKNEAAKAEVKGLMKRLESGVSGLMSSDGWSKWLSYQSTFHNYSLNNTLLIMMQCPAATKVAGFHTWKRLQRKIIKGSKSIRILAPRIFINADAGSDETEDKKILYFRAIGVFDVSQTEGEDLPTRPYTLSIDGDEDEGLYEKLRTFSASKGCPVNEVDIDGGCLGYYDPSAHSIGIKSGMSLARKAHVLSHEIAHSLLHRGVAEVDGRNPAHLSRGIKELEAESVAYIICTSVGLDVGTSSFGYIADWNKKETKKELTESAKRIASTAKGIIGGIA